MLHFKVTALQGSTDSGLVSQGVIVPIFRKSLVSELLEAVKMVITVLLPEAGGLNIFLNNEQFDLSISEITRGVPTVVKYE